MAWTPPIVDRTQEDVINQTAKGQCRYTDLNRLEENCAVLAAFFGVPIQTKTWINRDFPTTSHLSRIRGNVAALRAAGSVYQTTPTAPNNPLNSWQKWNDAERILLDVYNIYQNALATIIYTGEIYAGENIGVI